MLKFDLCNVSVTHMVDEDILDEDALDFWVDIVKMRKIEKQENITLN